MSDTVPSRIRGKWFQSVNIEIYQIESETVSGPHWGSLSLRGQLALSGDGFWHLVGRSQNVI